MKLYTYYQSSASYRVRIALNLKGIRTQESYIDLTKGEQHSAEYEKVNPQKMVPALILDSGKVLTQSIAIIEYLEETHPEPPVLPKDPVARAQARAIALAVAADISPLNNLKIRKWLKSHFGATDQTVKTDWIQHWIADGFIAIESLLGRSTLTGKFCVGDCPTLADCCLIPQIFNAKRFELDMEPYPAIRRIGAQCEQHPAFQAAHPSQQKDAV